MRKIYIKRQKTSNQPEIIKSVLLLNEFSVNKVTLAEKTEIKSNTLYIDRNSISRALKANSLVKHLSIDIIEPDKRDVQTNTVMDIMPIATKVDGKLGKGTTNWLSGVVVFLTGVDEAGKQVAELGSSQGILLQKVQFGTPGTPGLQDIIIRLDVVIEKGTGMERRGPIAAHQVCDAFIQEIRAVLKMLPTIDAVRSERYEDVRRPGKPKVLIVKLVSGQGAMQEKFILPNEPAGINGAKSVFDAGNIPVMISSTEIKDGGIHSLT